MAVPGDAPPTGGRKGRTWLAAAGLCLLAFLPLVPALCPGRVLLPYDPRLHRPFADLLSPATAAELLAGSAGIFGDGLLQCLPLDRFTAAELEAGRLPLWNPQLFAGIHHAGQGTGQAFYLPAWCQALADPLRLKPFLMAGHLAAGALGLLGLLRLLGADGRAALAGAGLWTLSGWAWTNLHHQPILHAGSWLFPGLWALEALSRRPLRPAGLAVLAAATAFTLSAGFPQTALLSLLLLAAYGLVAAARLARAGGGRRAAAFALPALAAAGAGLLLAAPALLALAQEAGLAGRTALTAAALRTHALAPAHLLGLALPELLAPLRGNPYGALGEMHPTYALLAWVDRPAAVLGALNAKETWLYLGILPLLLALAAVPRWREGRTLLFLGAAGTGLLIALGAPGLVEAWTRLPGGAVGDTKRLLFWPAAAGPLLAGLGLDRLLRRGRTGPGLALAAWLLLPAAAAALAAALFITDERILRFWLERVAPLFAAQIEAAGPGRPPWLVLKEGVERLFPGEPAFNAALTRGALLRFGLAALGAAVPLLLARVRAGRFLGPALAAGLALALGDLFYTAIRMARPVAAADLPRLWQAAFPGAPPAPGPPGAPGRLLRLEASPGRRDKPDLLPPGLPALLGIADAQGYAPLMPARIRDLFAALDPALDLRGAGVHSLSRPEQLASPLMALLRPGLLLADVAVDLPGWEPAGATPAGCRLYVARSMPPFARTVPRAVVPPEALAWLASPRFRPDEEAVLARPLPGDVPAEPGVKAPAVLLARTAGRILLQAEGAGVLKVAEGWHPGWEARVDGREAPVLCVDHAFLGVPLLAGSHEVELRFQPAAVARGRLLAAAGLAGLGVLLAFGLRRAPGARP